MSSDGVNQAGIEKRKTFTGSVMSSDSVNQRMPIMSSLDVR